MNTEDKIDIKSIKKIVVQRAGELGNRIKPQEVELEFLKEEVARGCRIFTAHWVSHGFLRSLSGLIMDNDPPDTYPARAVGKIFRRWLDTRGGLPDPEMVANVVSLFFDPSRNQPLIMKEEDKSMFIELPEWIPYVELPKSIEVSGHPGVEFWRSGPYGLSKLRIFLSAAGMIQIDEHFLKDIVASKINQTEP